MKKIVYAAILLICALTLCSCGTKKYTAYSFDYFDTVTTVIGYAGTQKEFDAVGDEIFSALAEYHRLFDIYHSYDGLENLCTLNEKREIRADVRILDMLSYAKEMYETTNGKCNIAMGSVLSIWHDYREDGVALPPMALLETASAHTDIRDLQIDRERGTVSLLDPEMTLDVGAIAKGYAAEMVARALEEKGVTGYLINVGGNVRTVGTRADGSKWQVSIENPIENGGSYLDTLSLAGESLVTSGSYQRFYSVDGKNYHHIIDPETLLPSEYFLSVSVVCRNSAMADALSTALFCMPFRDGLSLIESTDGAEALWLFSDGTVKLSGGWQESRVG